MSINWLEVGILVDTVQSEASRAIIKFNKIWTSLAADNI